MEKQLPLTLPHYCSKHSTPSHRATIRQVIPIATMSDDKGDIQHHELPAVIHDDGDLDKAGVQGPLASKYATMSLKDTLKTFRLTCLYALMAAFNACNDGYCYSIPGTSKPLPLPVFMAVQ